MSLFFIWIICLLGFISVYKLIRDEKRKETFKQNIPQIDYNEKDIFYTSNTTSTPIREKRIDLIKNPITSPEYVDLDIYEK